nr:hypothetical protein [Candidatus Sigynarchaeota archaeon]
MCANPDPSDVAFEKILALIPGFKRPKSRGNRPFGIYAPPRFGDREIEARRFRNIANGKGLYYFYLVATVLASKKSQGRFHASLKHQYTNWLHAPYDNWTYPFTDKQIAVLDTFENQKAFKALTGLAPGAAWHVSHKKNAMPIGSPKLDSWIKPAPAKILNQGSAGESNTNLAKPPARTQQRGVSSSPDYITIKCLQRENRRVAIINGMVTQLYRREIMFQDHPSVYYLAQITGGYASCELKVRLLAYPVKATKARLTE